MKYCFLLVGSIFLNNFCFAQTEKAFSGLYHFGTIYAHTKDVENTAGSKPVGFELQYHFKKTDSVFYKSFSGFPTQGFALNFTNFNNTILGNGVVASYFIAPSIAIGKLVRAEFNFNAGLAYLNNPNKINFNPNNQSYSTYLSAYLAVGFRASFNITKQLSVFGGYTYRHTSNGGVKLPNKGINWITNNIGLQYATTAPKNTKSLKQLYSTQGYKKQNFWELNTFLAVRSINNESPVKYGIAGIALQHNWQTASTHSLTLGAEFFIDNALREQLRLDYNIINAGLRSGVLIGHKFIWGKVYFGQEIGLYLINPHKLFPGWYHRWTITHRLSKQIAMGVSLLAHRHIANFPDFRLVYRW